MSVPEIGLGRRPAPDTFGAHMTLETSQPTTLLLLAGHPGAGKSTLALTLGRRLGWPVLDKDTFKSTLIPSTCTCRGVDINMLAYELIAAVAGDLLAQRRSLIIDSPLKRPVVIEQLGGLAVAAQAQLKVILCLADDRVRNERLAARAPKASQLRAHGIETDQEAQFGHLPTDTLTLHTDHLDEHLVRAACDYLAANPGHIVGT